MTDHLTDQARKERPRDGHLWKNLVYSFRVLLKRPSLTVVAILAIALGIGANTAIFSVVNTVLLQPLPYEDPKQLVMAAGRATRVDPIVALRME